MEHRPVEQELTEDQVDDLIDGLDDNDVKDEAEDVVEQAHQVLTGGRLNLPEEQLNAVLGAIADCDVRLRRSSQGRIQIEQMLHAFAAIRQQ